MQGKEAFDLAVKYMKTGLSAGDLKESVATWMDKETLEALWSIPRRNINSFITGCLSSLAFNPPFLDLGCGRRSLKPEIQRTYGDNIVFIGIDHHLPSKKGNQPQHLPDIVARAENLPIRNESIGTVFCMELLEHVPDEHRVLGEIGRIIYPDGHLILSLPGLDIPKHEKLPFQRDYRRISPGQVENLLRINGFRTIKVDIKALEGLQTNIFVIAKKR